MRLSDRMEVGFDLRPRPSPDALIPPLTRHEVLLLPRQLLVRLQRAGDGAGHLRHELVLLGRSRPRYRGGRRPARSWPGWLRRSPGERWRPRSPGEVGGGLGDPPGEAHQEQPGHEQGDEATWTALIRHLAGSSPGSLRDEPFCQPDDSGTARVEAAFGRHRRWFMACTVVALPRRRPLAGTRRDAGANDQRRTSRFRAWRSRLLRVVSGRWPRSVLCPVSVPLQVLFQASGRPDRSASPAW